MYPHSMQHHSHVHIYEAINKLKQKKKHTYFKQSKCPPAAALSHTLVNLHPFSCTYFKQSKCPLPAARAQMRSSHPHPFSCAYLSHKINNSKTVFCRFSNFEIQMLLDFCLPQAIHFPSFSRSISG
jgi:hypothetical protein